MADESPKVEDLFSVNGGFDEAELVLAIKPFVTIQESTKLIFIKNSTLTAEKQILIYGIAKKLLKSKQHIESEMITATEIQRNLKIKKGTIDPIFMKLKKSGFLIGKVNYEIPVSKISEVINLLERK